MANARSAACGVLRRPCDGLLALAGGVTVCFRLSFHSVLMCALHSRLASSADARRKVLSTCLGPPLLAYLRERVSRSSSRQYRRVDRDYQAHQPEDDDLDWLDAAARAGADGLATYGQQRGEGYEMNDMLNRQR